MIRVSGGSLKKILTWPTASKVTGAGGGGGGGEGTHHILLFCKSVSSKKLSFRREISGPKNIVYSKAWCHSTVQD